MAGRPVPHLSGAAPSETYPSARVKGNEGDSPRRRASGDVENRVEAPVAGPVIQGRDYHGDFHFHVGHGAAVARTPREVPPTPDPFVDREEQIDAIARLAAPRGDRGRGRPVIVLLRGGRGVGKTAMGCYWAHANSERFSDGQLYVDFREHRHDGPSAVGEILAELLRSLGLRNEAIPIATGERSRRFRTETADKRLLLLLDDVELASEVTQLLPTSAESVVLVTSHQQLKELFRLGGRPVDLPPLDQESAEDLLVSLIGEQRAREDLSSVARLVEICGGLPIALGVCGELLASTGRSTAWLAELLSDERQRLSRIEFDEQRSLQIVFDEAYSALSPGAQTLHRRLGVFPGTSVTPVVAAAAADIELDAAAELLDELATARLIEQGAGFRFRYHDLLHTHAHVVALRTDAEPEREAAVRRVVDWYVGAAQRMDRAIALDRLRLGDEPLPPVNGEQPPATPAEALAWFEFERPNLLAILDAAYDRELDDRVWMIGEALWLAYRGHGHWQEAQDVFALATNAARRSGDIDAEARMRSQLARSYMELGDHDRAAEELAACEAMMEHSPNRALAASIIEWKGVLHLARDEDRAALAAFEQALELFTQAGKQRGIAMQRYLLGRTLVRTGDPRRAVDYLQAAIGQIDRETDQFLYGRVQWRLGEALAALGEIEPARCALEDAVEVLQRHSASVHEASARETLADLERSAGNSAAEVEQLERALAIYAEFGVARAEDVRARLASLAP